MSTGLSVLWSKQTRVKGIPRGHGREDGPVGPKVMRMRCERPIYRSYDPLASPLSVGSHNRQRGASITFRSGYTDITRRALNVLGRTR